MTVTGRSDMPTLGKLGEPPTAKEISLFFDLVRENRERMRITLGDVNSAGPGPVIYFMIMHACIEPDDKLADALSIATHVNCPRTTVQRHLKELKTIGWVLDHQVGKRVCWSATELGRHTFYKTMTAIIEHARSTYSQLLQVGGELDNASGTETKSEG